MVYVALGAGEATCRGPAVAEQYAAEHYCYSRSPNVGNLHAHGD